MKNIDRVIAMGLLVFAAATAVNAATAPVAAPASAASGVNACKLEISGTDAMQFDKKELRVSASCKTVTLTLKHSGKLPVVAMGHNWVLATSADMQPLVNAGMAAGIKNNHVPPGDKRVIAFTKVIGGGESASVTFPGAALKKGGDYTFFCSFPGHFGLMRGKFVVL